MFRNRLGIVCFIKFILLIPDRKCIDRLLAMMLRYGRNQARIYTSTQKCTEWNITDHAIIHRRLYQIFKLLLGFAIIFKLIKINFVLYFPKRLHRKNILVDMQPMTCRKFMNLIINRHRRWYIT